MRGNEHSGPSSNTGEVFITPAQGIRTQIESSENSFRYVVASKGGVVRERASLRIGAREQHDKCHTPGTALLPLLPPMLKRGIPADFSIVQGWFYVCGM